MTLSEAASLLPSFLLPPDTDLSALPAPAAGTGDPWHNNGALVGGGAAWGHVAGAPAPVSASCLHPVSVTPSSYGHVESDNRMCALFGDGAGAVYAAGGLCQAYSAEDVGVVSEAMGWRYPRSCPDDTFVNWDARAAPGASEEFGMWGGLWSETSCLRGGMGPTNRGIKDDSCDFEVIAAARSLKQLLAMPYSDQRVSLAVHRVGETLFIDQPPPAANQSWCGREASAPGDRDGGGGGGGGGGDGGGGGGGDGRGGSGVGGCSHAPGDSPSLHAEELQEEPIEEPPRGQAQGGTAPAREGGEEGARRRRKRSGKKNAHTAGKKHTLNLEHLLYSQLIAAGARGGLAGAPGGLQLPLETPGPVLASKPSVDPPSPAPMHVRGVSESFVSSSDTCVAGRNVLDKWADSQWAHAQSSSDEEDVDKGGVDVGGAGGEGVGGFVPVAPRMCRFRLGSLRMLLGSDVVVLDHPSSGQPCVSLYVRDPEIMSRAGFLDMWLDNVMASVPHVLMCWHKDAVIQGYMLKRTQDLPALSRFEFSPERIERCGKQVLKWLHTNCTTEASTYWLLKERGDERLQLYNLSALHEFTANLGADASSSSHTPPGANDEASAGTRRSHVPEKFAFPVAMLCIRAAARLASQVSPEARARRRELLLQSVTLLDEDVHASLLAQVHDCIADTYVSIPVVDLDQDLARQTPLGCVESYPSLHADTFVLPSSDKRRDAELAAGHLSKALGCVYRTLPSGNSASSANSANRPALLMAMLVRVRRKAIECFAFLSQVQTSKGQWDKALEMLSNALYWAQPLPRSSAPYTGLGCSDALILARLRCLLGDCILSAAERQPTAPPTPAGTPIGTPAATPPPTPPPTPKSALRTHPAHGGAEGEGANERRKPGAASAHDVPAFSGALSGTLPLTPVAATPNSTPKSEPSQPQQLAQAGALAANEALTGVDTGSGGAAASNVGADFGGAQNKAAPNEADAASSPRPTLAAPPTIDEKRPTIDEKRPTVDLVHLACGPGDASRRAGAGGAGRKDGGSGEVGDSGVWESRSDGRDDAVSRGPDQGQTLPAVARRDIRTGLLADEVANGMAGPASSTELPGQSGGGGGEGTSGHVEGPGPGGEGLEGRDGADSGGGAGGLGVGGQGEEGRGERRGEAVSRAGCTHMPQFPPCGCRSVLDLSRVQALSLCAEHYERARGYLQYHQSYVDFVAASRRLGHVRNELGKVAGRESDMDEAERHWRAAQGVFASIGDGENHAVLNINLAQLLRRRSADLQEKAGTLTHAARTHIAEAVSMYQAAFGALKKKQGSPTVWEMVQSELATTFEDFAVMLETDACSQSWNSEGAREDAQLVVDLRNRAMDLLRESRAPAWRLAQAHLSLGSFYFATLHVGGGCVTRTRYDAAEGQLRKCLLVASAGSAADFAPPSASHLKRSLPQQILGQAHILKCPLHFIQNQFSKVLSVVTLYRTYI